jgi:integrase
MKTPLSGEQARKLLEALQGHRLEVIITVALVSGLRRNELLHLTWRDTNLEKCELRVLDSKTKSGYRLIPLSEDVTKLLKQHRLRQMEAQGTAGAAWLDRDLVFSNQTGGFLGSEQLVQGFHEVLEQAGLPPIRFHDLRVAVWLALREQGRTAKERVNGAQAEDRDLGKNINPS